MWKVGKEKLGKIGVAIYRHYGLGRKGGRREGRISSVKHIKGPTFAVVIRGHI